MTNINKLHIAFFLCYNIKHSLRPMEDVMLGSSKLELAAPCEKKRPAKFTCEPQQKVVALSRK